MATYLAFLRAINLGPTRKFPKDAIIGAVRGAGFTDVETYLNTGNVRFASSMRSRPRIEARLEAAFESDRGFPVPTVVFTPDELRAIAEEAAGFGHGGKHYVSLLKHEPSPQAVALVESAGDADEAARVGGRAVHLLLGENYHEARLTNAVVERHLGVATNRNLTVVTALARKWC